jgi:hypothetical protein
VLVLVLVLEEGMRGEGSGMKGEEVARGGKAVANFAPSRYNERWGSTPVGAVTFTD